MTDNRMNVSFVNMDAVKAMVELWGQTNFYPYFPRVHLIWMKVDIGQGICTLYSFACVSFVKIDQGTT
jgi:hypothetical protein